MMRFLLSLFFLQHAPTYGIKKISGVAEINVLNQLLLPDLPGDPVPWQAGPKAGAAKKFLENQLKLLREFAGTQQTAHDELEPASASSQTWTRSKTMYLLVCSFRGLHVFITPK